MYIFFFFLCVSVVVLKASICLVHSGSFTEDTCNSKSHQGADL